mmetsp:Transcript_12647/g.31802  ORF Transcript_12647/g.31802 Transcript_12647/m.31802 type:complete len:128 (+) Transcript_12647:86-469(+)
MEGKCADGACEKDVVIIKHHPEDDLVKEQDDQCTDQSGVTVFHRHSCPLCWVTRWHLWQAGIPFQLRNIDNDDSWGAAMYRNGYEGGTFALPVVTHGCKAWWSISDNKELTKELKTKMSQEVVGSSM